MSVRVAIIEDSKELAETIEKFLTKKGLSVTAVANDGHLGQSVITEGNFDVLLLDLILPNIDGLTLIKNFIPKERHYKVICFSAFGRESVLLEANALGVDYFLLKPVNLDVIYQNIVRLCARDNTNEKLLDDYFSPRLKGTQYLMDALAILEVNPHMLDALTRELYPEIALKNDVNTATIERAIRNAIDKAWKEGLEQKWLMIGRITRPTVGELLEYMRGHHHD